MEAEQADLMSLGDHCEVPECNQIDFLPFQCDACHQVYCLQHRSYQAHCCQKAGERETTAILCPLCAKAIRLSHGQDPNAAFAAHTAEGCDPTNYARVHKKPKCPVPGCKEKLTTINTYSCKSCSTEVCLKHRFPGDHDCTNRAAAARAQRQPVTTAVRSFLGLSPGRPQHNSQKPKAGGAAKAASKAASIGQAPAYRPAATAASRAAAQAAERRSGTGSRAQNGSGQMLNASSQATERCPQCGEQFHTLQELLFHVDAFHPAGVSSGPGAVQEHLRCPHCSQTFADPVSLVQHVEGQHAKGARKHVCVMC